MKAVFEERISRGQRDTRQKQCAVRRGFFSRRCKNEMRPIRLPHLISNIEFPIVKENGAKRHSVSGRMNRRVTAPEFSVGRPDHQVPIRLQEEGSHGCAFPVKRRSVHGPAVRCQQSGVDAPLSG